MDARRAFLSALAEEQARWRELLAAAGEARATQAATIGAWSIRDVVAHLAFWTHHAGAHVEAIAGGRAPEEAALYGAALPPDLARDDDTVNDWALAGLRHLSLAEVLAYARQADERLAAALGRLGDGELCDRGRAFPGLPWKGERTLIEVLDILVLQHAAEHRAQVESWLARRPEQPRSA